MASLELHPWRIIQHGLDNCDNRHFESIMSSGNSRFGLRGNHEEPLSGDSLRGTYIAGVFYPDKTRVGWWKNGYPESFAKVLNAADFLAIDVDIDGEALDLANGQLESYERVLDMKQSVLFRHFTWSNAHGVRLHVEAKRFLSSDDPDLAVIEYQLGVVETPDGLPVRVSLSALVDGDVRNEDANYGEVFWEPVAAEFGADDLFTVALRTKKTAFTTATACAVTYEGPEALQTRVRDRGKGEGALPCCGIRYQVMVEPGTQLSLHKYIAVLSDRYTPAEGITLRAMAKADDARRTGSDVLFKAHAAYWDAIWSNCDVVIEGDVAAQQGIRYTIYQLLCTYSGSDARLNIGPKGFTGEKYGGGTYWDTEAYALYFSLGTHPPQVTKQLLQYRHAQLDKARENARKLGLAGALYPMVTMTGEECHNEWEITFEEIHRNAAIACAVRNYTDYTGDRAYLYSQGIDVLVETARFWASRASYSEARQAWVILGVTGPNEYENNVNNNWYTNRMARWNLEYAANTLNDMRLNSPPDYETAVARLKISAGEPVRWCEIAGRLVLPYDESRGIFLQQDGFLDKILAPAVTIPAAERPIHRHWSWDRILRSCYIKQADVLQGLWFLNDDFTVEQKKRNFDFYEPMTVHESSLSPCIHAILAAETGDTEKSLEFYMRSARLDLDDLNRDTSDGLHITSMAGAWMSIVHGLGGLRACNGVLHINPVLPKTWHRYAFSIWFRGAKVSVDVRPDGCEVKSEGELLELASAKRRIRLENGGMVRLPLQTNSLSVKKLSASVDRVSR